jgi:hypothetical protein
MPWNADTGTAVRVTGLRELRAELKRLEKVAEWRREFRQAGLGAAAIAAAEARRRVPVDSGELLNSIRPGSTATRGYIAAGNNTRVPYAGVIEWGWPKHNIRPDPYLEPAVQAKESQIVKFYLAAVDRLAKRAFPQP